MLETGVRMDKTSFAKVGAGALLALVLNGSAVAQSRAGSADLILTNGKIRTPSGWAEAMAVRKGVIIAVGDAAAVSTRKDEATRTIDLAGKTVLPGLHDMHVHPLFAGLEKFTCGFAPGAKAAEIRAAVKACVAARKPGEWVLGGNWVAAGFKPGQQTRQFLDAVSPDNPVLLTDEAHHSVWANSAALKLANVTRDTPAPLNGLIERDAKGEPTGLLRETATDLVERIVPPPTPAERRRALTTALDEMLSFGITSLSVASVRRPDMEAFAELAADGTLKQRVRGCIVWSPEPAEVMAEGEELIADRGLYQSGRFKPDCVKLFLDGVPTESHTAAMLAPYVTHGKGNGAPETGILNIPPAALNAAVARFDRMGLHVKFHAAGDGAVREAIDAVAYARKVNGWGGPIHDVGHSTFVDRDDIPRVKAVQMAWEFSPYIWYPTPMAANDVALAVGPERMKRWIPIREAVESEAMVVAGSDWSVVPSVNPWLAIETLVTREKPGGSAEKLAPEQSLTLDQAMRIFTENGAMQMGHRDQVGSIEVGMRADLAVTQDNPYTMPIRQLHTIKVAMTFIDGELVYQAPQSK